MTNIEKGFISLGIFSKKYTSAGNISIFKIFDKNILIGSIYTANMWFLKLIQQ